jgi:hypothetical protein
MLELSLSVNLVMLSNGLVVFKEVLGLSVVELTLENILLFKSKPSVEVYPIIYVLLIAEGRVLRSALAKLKVSFMTSPLNLTFSTLFN